MNNYLFCRFLLILISSFISSRTLGQEDFLCGTEPIDHNVHNFISVQPLDFVCGNHFRVYFWILRDDEGLNGIDQEMDPEDRIETILTTLNNGFNFGLVNPDEINSPFDYID